MIVRCLTALLICLCLVMTACTGPAQNSPTPDNHEQADDYTEPDDTTLFSMDTVLFKVGDMPVTYGEFMFRFGMLVQNFFSSGQADYYGIDPSTPLAQQYYDEESETSWQDMFDQNAYDTLHRALAMNQEAQAQGYLMGDWENTNIQSFWDNVEGYAKENDMTVGECIEQQYGAGMTAEMVTEYQKRYWLGLGYENDYRKSHAYTDAELEAYYAQHEEQALLPDCTAVTIREIFISNKQTARDVLNNFKQGDGTEDFFAQLAKTYSEDNQSNADGGLYENITPQNDKDNLSEIDKWLFDNARKPGDYTLIEGEYGNNLLYFVSKGEPYWKIWSRDGLLNDYVTELLEKYPLVGMLEE